MLVLEGEPGIGKTTVRREVLERAEERRMLVLHSRPVTARDKVDTSVAVSCRPASGSRVRVGRRTRVSCSATDTSANTARTTFTVSVRRR